MYEARVRGGKLFPFCNWLLIRLLERRKRGGTEKERVSEKGGEEREERRSRRRERERETETQRERAQDYSKSKGTGEIDLRRKSGKCERGMRKTRLEVHPHTYTQGGNLGAYQACLQHFLLAGLGYSLATEGMFSCLQPGCNWTGRCGGLG